MVESSSQRPNDEPRMRPGCLEPFLHPASLGRIVLLRPATSQKVRQRMRGIRPEDRPHGVGQLGAVPVRQILLQ